MSDHDSDAVSLSSNGPSSTEPSRHGDDQRSESSSFNLGKAETKAVRWSKLAVFGFIALATAASGFATYRFTRNEEVDDFQAEFSVYADEVLELVQYEGKVIFESVESMALSISSFAIETNVTWPHLTVPHFELRGERNHLLSKALSTSFIPLVTEEQRESWEEYSVKNQGWIEEGLLWSNRTFHGDELASIPENLWRYQFGEDGPKVEQKYSSLDFGLKAFAPLWQQSPAPSEPTFTNYDLLSKPIFRSLYGSLWESRLPVFSQVLGLHWLHSEDFESNDDEEEHPHSFLLQPVYPYLSQTLPDRDDISGIVISVIPWDNYFNNLLNTGIDGVIIVVRDSCGDLFTYELNGPVATFVGVGDWHDVFYEEMVVQGEFAPNLQNRSASSGNCEYDLRIYPSAKLESIYLSNNPVIFMSTVMLVFVFTALVFVIYDIFVERRQYKVYETARRTNQIVSSLFPANVRDRLFKDAEERVEAEMEGQRKMFRGAKTQLKDFLDEGAANAGPCTIFNSAPIADLFPQVTVMFADIVGFTAWSSVREPSQVFSLLEAVYHAFDELARQRRVFKVETVGDCYVAAAGIPEARADHAVVMARFARDCVDEMNQVTKELEMSLGPDTTDLAIRVGLNSGPVTAGVLRGDKSRFQLFGDTMNTTARIESSGEKNRVHISAETAELLRKAGKEHWLKARTDTVTAKGKGAMKTFWLELRSGTGTVTSESTEEESDSDITKSPTEKSLAGPIVTSLQSQLKSQDSSDKFHRLITWNVEMLARLIKQIIARRNSTRGCQQKSHSHGDLFHPASAQKSGHMVIDEVKEIIKLPRFDHNVSRTLEDSRSVVLSEKVMAQLLKYVAATASLYRDNAFHNFEHASHVTMSVTKLLSRIVAPEMALQEQAAGADEKSILSNLHDHTYGITSDPLTQFACVFSALIHDVDHTGVSNKQLVAEKCPMAAAYNDKSIAEQNSVDIAWGLLMDPEFHDLREAICTDTTELQRFRQLVVNSVMATDIMDKDLGAARKERWNKAFAEEQQGGFIGDVTASVNRKATIVIEHLIQASDVAHTMQHWHVYRKWNERLFLEMLSAYKAGRAETDPSLGWYQGELGFFDYYVIPLAQKLKTCGVFGVTSDEYLTYALQNRNEWEQRGQEIVQSMVSKCA